MGNFTHHTSKPFTTVVETRPPVVWTQPNPTQYQWYNVLAVQKEILLKTVMIAVETTGETLQMQWNVDGLIFSTNVAAVAGTRYAVYMFMEPTVGGELTAVSYAASAPWGVMACMYQPFEALSCSINMRKITAAGTGTLKAWVNYAVRL